MFYIRESLPKLKEATLLTEREGYKANTPNGKRKVSLMRKI